MERFLKYKYILLVSLLAFLSVLDLLHQGLPPTHDGEYHVVRFYEFDKSLRAGNFYPRWAQDLNNGYGVPLFNYVYPLPNYVSSALHFLGISFIDAFKSEMIIATLAGAFFMYLWARIFWGEWGGLIASVFYTFSPYHLLDIYIRGSVGEVWALGLFPAFLWSFTQFIKKKETIFFVLACIFLTSIIFTHNILALMFFPFALSYGIVLASQKQSKGSFPDILAVFSLALCLSSIFWLPAIVEKQYVVGLDVFDYRRHFAEIYQLIFPSWGSGFSADPATPGLSMQIGVANLIVLVLSSASVFIYKKRLTKIFPHGFMIVWAILCVLLMIDISKPIWEKIPLMQFFQFPWRFLSLVILISSFLAGSIAYIWHSKILLVILTIATISLSFGYAKTPYYLKRNDSYYTSRSNFINGTNSPGNAFNTIWFNRNLAKTDEFSEKIDGKTVIHVAYFPDWQVFIDGKSVETRFNKDGLIEFNTPQGNHDIELKLLDTPVRKLSWLIFFVSFAILIALCVKSLRVRMKYI